MMVSMSGYWGCQLRILWALALLPTSIGGSPTRRSPFTTLKSRWVTFFSSLNNFFDGKTTTIPKVKDVTFAPL